MSEKKISFGKVFWPSLLASSIIALLIFLVVFLLIGGLFPEKPAYKVEQKSVLHMQLKGDIKENSKIEVNPTSLSIDKTLGLADILYGIGKAKSDPNIEGIFLEVDNLSCGYSSSSEIRNALKDFQNSGKFIHAYNKGEVITLKEYYLSSVANTNYGFPSSMMEFGGLGVELMYYKNMLDKLDVEMQVIRGKNNDFKSAVEPYFRSSMSDSSRLQTETLLTGIWNVVQSDISLSRSIEKSLLKKIADSTLIRRASDAVKYDLLDGVKYRDEVLTEIANQLSIDKVEELSLVSFQEYAKKKFYSNQLINRSKKANVAVILAEGAIATEGADFTSKEIVNLFRKVRLNDDIKTVVFRVNSPGGSALASDEIWREVKLTAAKKKVIVSMGDVAASGGYYVSAPAHRIFAEKNTITGSIGVFGVIPYTGDLFENKIGITFDYVKTNPHAVLSLNKKLTKDEFTTIQQEVNFIYDEFLERVAEGRSMTKENVNKIARGRVWTGEDALQIGLVDEIGGLTDALNYAIKEANIDKAIIEFFPEKKTEPWEEIIENLNEEKSVKMKSSVPQELLKMYQKAKEIEGHTGIQMRGPAYIFK